jgi:uncharacterized protein (TIGR03067 family)
MDKLLVTALAVLLVMICEPTFSQEKDDPASALNGEWEVVEMIYMGKVQDFGGKPERYRFKDGKMWHSFKNDGEFKFEGEYSYGIGKPFTIRRGRELDVDDRGRVEKGLYELKDGNLRIVWREDLVDRPTGFGAVADPGLTLQVLKRITK